MIVKKTNGKIYGAQLTANERKAARLELKRELLELDKQFQYDRAATLLWFLHVKHGFGKRKMINFFRDFRKYQVQLAQHYLLDAEDISWMCTRQLKEMGIDIPTLYEEIIHEQITLDERSE